MSTLTTRTYQPVLGEITTALFACPDCGTVVWHALRKKHDQLHEQINALIDNSHRQAELIDADGERLEDLEGQIGRVAREVDDLDTARRRLDDAVRDIGYRADDAQRTAERAADAAASASRGW